MANKIKAIGKRLNDIAALKTQFHFNQRDDSSRHSTHKEREATHSFVLPPDIIGRDKDKKELIKLLHTPTDGAKISVIPVLGLGGLGKTALAQLVYNDESVDKSFPLKMWVCVADEFDIRKLVEKIIKAASNGSTSMDNLGNMEMEQLQKQLREKIRDNKYLLVLDDVWNQDPLKWHELMELLETQVHGSKILVTTRIRRVASVVGTVPAYELSGLSDDDCLSLFIRCAFKSGDEARHPKLVEIGKKIVKKCGGVPLAVKTLASSLFKITDEGYWNSIKDSKMWKLEQTEKGILPALRISYEQLPSSLKRCFAYCSFFPKDYQYTEVELMEFWMAHGLLQPKNENEQMEDIGMQYLEELWSTSFFQDFEEEMGLISCKMHDLLHDLATSLIQNECSIIKSGTQKISCSNTVRHLLFGDPSSVPEGLSIASDGVRTIAPFIEGQGFSRQSIIQLCLSRFQYLRYLNLTLCEAETLPEGIGVLKHLRFLDLSSSKIERLPNSLYKLQNLQTLRLGGCNEFEELPSDIRYLISLRSLYITTKQKHLPNNGIGCLKSLRILWIGECENLEYLFEDMQGLTSLRELFIARCSSLICLPHSMKSLTALETLLIVECENLNLRMEEDGKDTQFCLQILMLGDLPKLVDLPQWLLQGSTNSLRSLHLAECKNLKQMPAFLSNVTSLQQLEIKDCGELGDRCKHETGQDWSKIAHIPKIMVDD